jgi:hypothetical protein
MARNKRDRTQELYRQLRALELIGAIDRWVASGATFHLDEPYTPTAVVQQRGKILLYEADPRKQKQLQLVAGVFPAIACYVLEDDREDSWGYRKLEVKGGHHARYAR